MFIKMKTLIFFLSFFLSPCLISSSACSYNSSAGCNNHGVCTRTGTCLCDLYYYGVNCESGI